MSLSDIFSPLKKRLSTWLTPRRLRGWRENLTAYLMIGPAVSLIFLFGIFPVGFALFVSLHKWRLKRGDIIGLVNYTKAIGPLAYLLIFVLGVGLLFLAFRQLQRNYKEFEGRPLRFWIFNIPGVLLASAGLSFVNWTVVLLPNILDIADKIRGVEKTRELFVQLLGEAFSAPLVLTARGIMFGVVLAALIAVSIAFYFWRTLEDIQHQFSLAAAWLLAGAGAIVLQYVYGQMMLAYTLAMQTGEDPGILPQIVSISSGVILLFIGWKLWQKGSEQESMALFSFRIFGAMVFIVGGWIMIGELPIIVAAGDPDLWVGLKATLFYSLGTIPFQLGISIFLAVLLFQNLKGSAFFRMMFFMPYVTPTVASAAVFRQLFSNRQQAPINAGMKLLGMEPLQWLWEPKGILRLMANNAGIENWPAWADGPSLALGVVIIYSIWVFVGYNTVIYLAGLGNISKEVGEAAEVDGASRWQIFRHITFPLLSPTTYFLTLISVIGTFKAFNHIWIMRLEASLGTADTFSVVIFTEFFEKLRYGYASAMAFILFAIILGLTFVNNKIQGSRVFYG
ncbi:MAG: sugar ABC transporter permease [Anaerolineae bacterium]|nr:sugar ABC transporter permease [Anaerolineae bacterium]MBT7073871.1 sugar ABC transporter permease [Anaerolineae bacterium]MBT7783377.1 sugar ABC transporter permease [Anaerolineae bacterium]